MSNKEIFLSVIPRPKHVELTSGTIKLSKLSRYAPQCKIDRALAEEEYILEITADGGNISGGSERAVFYAKITLGKLTRMPETEIPCARIHDYPTFSFRGMHYFIYQRHFPRFEQIKQLIKNLAQWKINYLVLECPNLLPLKNYPELLDENSWSEAQFEELKLLAKASHIELIPLINTLGHMAPLLTNYKDKSIREDVDDPYELCASNPRSREFIKDFLKDIMAMFPDTKYFHIGGDEAGRTKKNCPECGKLTAGGDFAKLYTNYYNDLINWMKEHRRIPMIWGDMLIKHPHDIDNMSRDAIIVDWHYRSIDSGIWDDMYYETNSKGGERRERRELFGKYWHEGIGEDKFHEFPYCQFFKEHGFTVIGSTLSEEEYAYPPMVRPLWSVVNNKRFARKIARIDAMGMLNTNWGLDPLESSYLGLGAGAEYSWNNTDESNESFVRRFAVDFLKCPGDAPLILQLENFCTFQKGFQSKSWKECPEISDDLLGSDGFYSQIQNWNRAACRLFGKAAEAMNRLDKMILGEAKFKCLDLGSVYNDSMDCVSPSIALLPEPGKHRALGIDFCFSDNRLVAVNKDSRMNKLTVNDSPDRLYFMLAGRGRIKDGDHLADIRINFSPEDFRTVPLVVNKNIAAWDVQPKASNIAAAFSPVRMLPAFFNHLNALFITWVDNRRHIDSLEIVSVNPDGTVLLYAVTAAAGLKTDIDPAALGEITDTFMQVRDQIAPLKAQLSHIYGKIMVNGRVQPTLIDRLENLLQVYIPKTWELHNRVGVQRELHNLPEKCPAMS